MIVRDFIHLFRACPLCHNSLHVTAALRNGARPSENMRLDARIENNNLTIHIQSKYYVRSDSNNFEFTISAFDGHIIHCGQTSEFISLYDLDIVLTKNCLYCETHFNEKFSKSIRLFYNRNESRFTAEPLEEYFLINDEHNSYYFCNSFAHRISFINVRLIGAESGEKPSAVHTPYIPFEKFKFSNRKNLMEKLRNIQLLS